MVSRRSVPLAIRSRLSACRSCPRRWRLRRRGLARRHGSGAAQQYLGLVAPAGDWGHDGDRYGRSGAAAGPPRAADRAQVDQPDRERCARRGDLVRGWLRARPRQPQVRDADRHTATIPCPGPRAEGTKFPVAWALGQGITVPCGSPAQGGASAAGAALRATRRRALTCGQPDGQLVLVGGLGSSDFMRDVNGQDYIVDVARFPVLPGARRRVPAEHKDT